MTTYFTADTHFGHTKIIEFCRRPFIGIEDMDRELISRWNLTVGKDDEVYHLGDISFRGKTATTEILKQLNGVKHLIKGNHDHLNVESKDQFYTIKDYDEIVIEGQRIVLCHFPIESWHRMGYGAWHLHGHSHGNLLEFGKRWDVGVDVWHYCPVSFDELKLLFAGRPIETRDHHDV